MEFSGTDWMQEIRNNVLFGKVIHYLFHDSIYGDRISIFQIGHRNLSDPDANKNTLIYILTASNPPATGRVRVGEEKNLEHNIEPAQQPQVGRQFFSNSTRGTFSSRHTLIDR